MKVKELIPCAFWTPDCQGKWDFDGPVVTISSRYWPRGGGFHTYSTEHPEKGFQSSADLFPDVKPSASATIYLEHGEDEPPRIPMPGDADYKPMERLPKPGIDWGTNVVLAEAKFEAETEAEVKAQLEAWVRAQINEIARVIHDHYREVK